MPRKKLMQICSLEAYERINQWYMNRRGIDTRYALKVDTIYERTGHRNYLSIWLERFIIKWVNEHRKDWCAVKVANSGKKHVSRFIGGKEHGRVASVTYVKNADQIVGEPDIRIMRPRQYPLYFEVKIGSDKLSEAQKQFIKNQWGDVYVVGTVDEFLYFWDKLNA